MPVTAKLSKQFYDRLGEAVTNELVDWLNQVDAAYRTDLRELNELNFARFDAKFEQRIAGLEAKVEQRIAGLEVKVEQRLLELRAEIQVGLAKVDTKIEASLKEQTRFFFLAWATLLASNIALWFR